MTPRNEVGENLIAQLEVATAAVTARTGAGDQSDVLEHVQVMGEKVGRYAEPAPKLDRRPIRCRQVVNDGEPRDISERSM